MKRLILQVNVKLEDHTGYKRYEPVESLYKISEYQARLFADLWNVDYHQVTNCDYLPNKHPIYQRFKMYDMDYDQIFYLDMDAVILPNCPNPFELFKEHRFSAVRNHDWNNDTEKIRYYREEERTVYGASENYRGFCSGVMMIRRDFLDLTRDKWKQHLNTFETRGERDQGIFNKLVIELGEDYNELGEEWGAWYRTGKYIDHLGGPFRKFNFDESKYLRKNNISMPSESSLLDFF
jgi:hypothetical protein